MGGVIGSLINPFAKQFDLLGRQLALGFQRRHALVEIRGDQQFPSFAFLPIFWIDGDMAIHVFFCLIFEIKAEISLAAFGILTVAVITVF